MSATFGFMKFLQTTIFRQIQNEMNKSKNTVKNRWECVEIFTCACECVCVIVVYYCVCICKWYIVYVPSHTPLTEYAAITHTNTHTRKHM